jgi:TolB-like protein/DNA-binding winged helix-turn-helix (wHTH) protein/Tfp pilus assembly protein PilF
MIMAAIENLAPAASLSRLAARRSPGRPATDAVARSSGANDAAASGQPARFRFNDVEIYIAQQELWRAGKIVHVEPQVFDLLVHLVRNRDRVVSKDELIEAIWQGRIISETALSSCISAARRAVGDNGDHQFLIRTLHKRGFRFVGELRDNPAPAVDSVSVPPVAAAEVAPKLAPDAHIADATVSGPPWTKGPASIAALPFDNLGDNPQSEQFGCGISEDITRLLARNRWLTVLSRHSTAAFQGRKMDVRMVGQSLGVRYVLPGSVRRSNDALKISAELVRSADGVQIWAETYNLPIENIFDVQEEIARQIAATIEPTISRIEQQLAANKRPENLDAWDCYQRGLWRLWSFTAEGFERAERYFSRAVAIEPGMARAHAGLGYVEVQRSLYAAPDDRSRSVKSALQLGRTAVALDERDAFCRVVLGRALCLLRRNEEATAELETAIELNPSFGQAYFAQGFNKLWAGHPAEAEALLDRAILLSPCDNHLWSFHHVRSWANFSMGEYELAAAFAKCATRQPNVTYRAFATLVASLGNLADGSALEAARAELLRRKPDYCGRMARQEFFFCGDESFLERFVKGLHRAGIPD